ncbi:MAG TPA: ribokinase [Candidatus Methylomirabilis sp.]|nr:ribokinase [Candidatus Methylomirabilis sp.]
MQADICVVGGINMDLVVPVPHIPRPGETVQGGEVARFPGGKGSNQAVAASRLGAAVAMVGQVGVDAFGGELLASLRAARVETAGVRRVTGGATGVALISVAPSGENAIVVAPGVNMAWDERALEDVERAVAGCGLLVLNLEVSPPVIARAVRAARRAGVRVLLNPAPHRKGDEGCFGELDCFVPNQVEAALFAGREPEAVRDWADIGRRLCALGPRTVILTLGAEGALVARAGEVTPVPGFRVPVVDTTAAGDAFVGGLAVAMLRGDPLPEAVRYANACGALAVTKAGAQPSLPLCADVEALLARAERG